MVPGGRSGSSLCRHWYILALAHVFFLFSTFSPRTYRLHNYHENSELYKGNATIFIEKHWKDTTKYMLITSHNNHHFPPYLLHSLKSWPISQHYNRHPPSINHHKSQPLPPTSHRMIYEKERDIRRVYHTPREALNLIGVKDMSDSMLLPLYPRDPTTKGNHHRLHPRSLFPLPTIRKTLVTDSQKPSVREENC